MRADWVEPDVFEMLLTALMPENRLAIKARMASGLRINDVLSLRTADMKRRMTVREQKTQKGKRVYWPQKLYDEMMDQAGRVYVFQGRLDARKHRTRQAVAKDLKRVAELYRIDGKKIAEHISPHTARKIYAVEQAHSGATLRKVQELLNHSDEAVTMIYAMADALTAAKLARERKEPTRPSRTAKKST